MRLELKDYDGPRRFERRRWQIEVSLSRTNLEWLSAPLTGRETAQRIESDCAFAGPWAIGNMIAVVRAEPDTVHADPRLRGQQAARDDARAVRRATDYRCIELTADEPVQLVSEHQPPPRGPNREPACIYMQGEWWIDYYGIEHRIAEMDPVYARELLAYVRSIPLYLIETIGEEFGQHDAVVRLRQALDEFVAALPVAVALRERAAASTTTQRGRGSAKRTDTPR